MDWGQIGSGADGSGADGSGAENGEQMELISVFAKLKNYKTAISNLSSKKWIIPERINQYRYKGRLRDYDEYIKPNKETDFECVDYSTFKKIKK